MELQRNEVGFWLIPKSYSNGEMSLAWTDKKNLKHKWNEIKSWLATKFEISEKYRVLTSDKKLK